MWLETLPPSVAENIATFDLLLIGFLVEKRYVSRPATFANTLALNAHTYQQPFAPEWLIWYANIGLLVGGVAILSYATEESLSESFYEVTLRLYSSIPVGVVILITL
jgi:hypothetical protein